MSSPSRRQFLSVAAASAVVPAVAGLRGASAAPANPAKGLKIGVASYSLRKFPFDKMLAACQAMDVKYLTLKDVHLPRTEPLDATRATRQKIEAAGITVMGGGTISWTVNDEQIIRKDFEYAKAGGFATIVCAPSPDVLDTVEKLAKEYDIKIAIHNHGPEDKYFPAPKDALALISKRDPRMGLCIDIGHAARAGADIVDSVRIAGPRLHDLHMKDLADPKKKDSQVAVGKGALDIPGLFRALLKSGFAGHVSLEYEIDADDPVVGMRESLAYMRGVQAALLT